MKKTLLSTFILGSFASNAQAEISLNDYSEATSSYRDSYINGNLSVFDGRDNEQTSYQADLSFDYDQVLSSADVDSRFQFDAAGAFERGGSAGDQSEDNYTAQLRYTRDKYFEPNSTGGFWFGGATLGANSAFDNYDARFVFGLGYGRVKNVTPMARAIRVVEALQERGFITKQPSKAIYNKVARIVDREDEYRSKLGARDYQQNWVADVVDTLKEAGVVSADAGAAEVLRTFYVLDRERISTRRTGWKVRAGIGYAYQSFDSESDSDPVLEVGAEYHHPISNLTQFSNEFTATTILNNGDDSYSARNVMSLTHEISDRIDWENDWTVDYIDNGITGQDVTVNTFNSTFIYFLNNQLDYTLRFSVANFSGDENFDNQNGTDKSLFMGLRYRLK